MSYDLAQVELVFLVFCRIGGCLMLMPGFSSSRVPVSARLGVAVMFAVTIAPLIDYTPRRFQSDTTYFALMVAAESLVGGAIGLLGRILFVGLHFAAVAVGTMIGLTAGGVDTIDDGESTDPFAQLFTVTAATLFFILDLHLDVLAGLIKSYQFLPPAPVLNMDGTVPMVVASMDRAFVASLQIVSPFVIYSLLVNAAFGIMGKMVPNFPSYFISIPLLIIGGILIAIFLFPVEIDQFFYLVRKTIQGELG